MPDIAGAYAAIESRLSANWLTTPIGFENAGTEPAAYDANHVSVPWAYCEIYDTDAAIIGVGTPGAHTVVDTGEIAITVFVPQGTERALARQYAAEIGEIFRVKEFYQSAGVCVRSWTPRVGRGEKTVSENPNGNWWAVTVTIPFEFIRYT